MPRRQSLKEARTSAESLRERLSTQRALRMCILIVVVAAAFVAGFLIRSQGTWMSALGFSSGESIDSAAGLVQSESTDTSIAARVGEAQSILESYSLDTYNLNDATNTMLEDLMVSTGDPYAEYYDTERYNQAVRDASSSGYAGIGVLFAEYDGRAYAADVYPDSEAQIKGVRQGDYVVAIDGDRSHVWSVPEVITALSKEEGDTVIVTWLRPVTADADTGTEFTTSLQCQVYEQENVDAELVGTIGYITLHQITQNASDLITTAVEDLASQGAVAYVLDIRSNPGGYLSQTVDIASEFLPSGVIVNIETNEGISPRSSSGATITDAPLVVVVNQYTAAAAEVLAAALEENQRATLVGEKTQGKGSVQVLRSLTFGGGIRYTAAYYLTPLGNPINGVGVYPSIVVANNERSTEDAQRLVAIETATSLARS